MADSETQQQQVTSKTPATTQKNPKRVAAGKAIAEKTKQAREAQKKALAEAQIIIANNQIKQTEAAGPQPVAYTQSTKPPVEPESTKNVLITTQWPSVISIIVSLAGIYYKREEIKRVFTKKNSCWNDASPTAIACWCHSKNKSGNQKYGLNILFVFYNNGAKGWCTSSFLKSRRSQWNIYGMV